MDHKEIQWEWVSFIWFSIGTVDVLHVVMNFWVTKNIVDPPIIANVIY